MAMIECPKCHHHISSMARACPECGTPVKIEESVADEPVAEAPSPVETPTAEAPKTAPKEKKKEGMGGMMFLVLALLLSLLIGGLYLYDYILQRQRERHAYELLQDCSNPDRYEDYIARFPKSEHIDDVRQRLEEVSRQQEEWLHLIYNGSHRELQAFIAKHPTSPYLKVAQTRLDSLDWAQASTAHTLEAVSQYMTEHPDGYFIDQAETLRQTIERQRAEAAAARRDSIARTDSIV